MQHFNERLARKDSSHKKSETISSADLIRNSLKGKPAENIVSAAHIHLDTHSPSQPERSHSSEHIQTSITEARQSLHDLEKVVKKRNVDVKNIKQQLDQIDKIDANFHRELQTYQATFSSFDSTSIKSKDTKEIGEKESEQAFLINDHLQKEYTKRGVTSREALVYKKQEDTAQKRQSIQEKLERIEEHSGTHEPPQNLVQMRDDAYKDLITLQGEEMDQAREMAKIAARKVDIRRDYGYQIQKAQHFPLHTSVSHYGKFEKFVEITEQNQAYLKRLIAQARAQLAPIDVTKPQEILHALTKIALHPADAASSSAEATLLQQSYKDSSLIQEAHKTNLQLEQTSTRLEDLHNKTQANVEAAKNLQDRWWDTIKGSSFFYPVEAAQVHERQPEIDATKEASCLIYTTRAIMQDMGKDIHNHFNEEYISQTLELNTTRQVGLRRLVVPGVESTKILAGYGKLGLPTERRNLPLGPQQVERETTKGNYIVASMHVNMGNAEYGHAVAIKGLVRDQQTGRESYVVADVMTRKKGSWLEVPAHYIDLATVGYHVVHDEYNQA